MAKRLDFGAVTQVSVPIINRQVRSGDYAYEIVEGRNIITGVLPGDPFHDRAYGGAGAPHGVRPTRADTARVAVILPFVTLDELKSGTRMIEIHFYRLTSLTDRADITPQKLADLKASHYAEPLAAATSNDLQKAAQMQ